MPPTGVHSLVLAICGILATSVSPTASQDGVGHDKKEFRCSPETPWFCGPSDPEEIKAVEIGALGTCTTLHTHAHERACARA